MDEAESTAARLYVNMPITDTKTVSLSDATVTIDGVESCNIEISPYTYTGNGTGSTSNDLVNPVFKDVTISSTTANVSTTYVDFVGTYSPTVIYEEGTAKHNLYLGSGNNIYYPSREGYMVKACRAYFVLKNGLTAGAPNDQTTNPQTTNPVRAFVLNFGEDEETGIRSLTPAPSPKGEGSSYWYSLDGRRLNGKPTVRGVYVNNGRKVIIK